MTREETPADAGGNPAPEEAGVPSPHDPPEHLAVIMDGNGRWAESKQLNRLHQLPPLLHPLNNILHLSQAITLSQETIPLNPKNQSHNLFSPNKKVLP